MVNTFGGNWTSDKLRILEDYLKAYTTALKKQSFLLWYVDAFAGSGYVNLSSGQDSENVAQSRFSILGEEGDTEAASILKGSSRLAIGVADRPFDEFIFIEQNAEYANALSQLKQEFSGRSIRIVADDANKFLTEWCAERNRQLETPWRGERAVIFLDPFATEVDWQTVQGISETKSVDLWILFPLSALTRQLPNDREPDEANVAVLNRVFGGHEWHTELYSIQTHQTLFGDETQIVRDDQQAIVDLYLDKLRDVFPAVSNNPKWFRNSRNSPLFALMFAAANHGRGGQIAVGIANHLLDRW